MLVFSLTVLTCIWYYPRRAFNRKKNCNFKETCTCKYE